jgi:hypothetical protein
MLQNDTTVVLVWSSRYPPLVKKATLSLTDFENIKVLDESLHYGALACIKNKHPWVAAHYFVTHE